MRDDLISGGTKRCFVDRLIAGKEEVVYASPVYGGAQIAVAHAAREAGVRSTIFCAKRKQLHPRTAEAEAAGAKIVEVPYGYLSNVQSKARKYCEETGATMLPFGLECEEAFEHIAARAHQVQRIVGRIDEVWCVGGSGVLARAIRRGIEAERYNVVRIGRELTIEDDRTTLWQHPLKFEQDARIIPPFPSCSNYDAKCWEFIKKHGNGSILFWNVMA